MPQGKRLGAEARAKKLPAKKEQLTAEPAKPPAAVKQSEVAKPEQQLSTSSMPPWLNP